LNNRYPGKSTIDIITLIPYETFEKWKGLGKKGEEYEAIKKNCRSIKELYKQLQVEGKINCYELSTPLTEHFVNYEKGDLWFGSQSCPF
jgi:all-trans-retinol 13,14-reductase